MTDPLGTVLASIGAARAHTIRLACQRRDPDAVLAGASAIMRGLDAAERDLQSIIGEAYPLRVCRIAIRRPNDE